MPRTSIAAVLLLAVGFMFTPSADAAVIATFDFVALAAGTPGDKGALLEDGVENVFTDNGISVTLTATGGNPYLDDLSGGKPGGLGVCTVWDANRQCTPGSDDNTSGDEIITLTFSGVGVSFDLLGVMFNDAGHTQDFSKEAGGFDSGSGFGDFFPDLQGSDIVGTKGVSFSFQAPNGWSNGTEQLYISKISVSALGPGGEEVPEPGTIGLMLIGLGMLAGGRKFRNRKNS